tara:strand:+ start:116 stop:700 length:585 start_codon:yes stop_codon:yes gene_type:complete
MNLFALSPCPKESAMFMCDKHIGKLAVEGMQTLVSAMLISGAPPHRMPLTSNGEPHRGGYKHHPLTLWTAESLVHWHWVFKHTEALCEEFLYRFGKRHAVAKQLLELKRNFMWEDYVPDTQGEDRTRHARPSFFERCFNQSKGENLDLVDTDLWPCDHEAYREFYRRDKYAFAKWEKGRESPGWWCKPMGERKK